MASRDFTLKVNSSARKNTAITRMMKPLDILIDGRLLNSLCRSKDMADYLLMA
jgi:hypothetical protein